MNNKYYLIRYKGNYADEFNVESFSVETEDEYNEFMNAVKIVGDNDGYISINVGTNESIEYDDINEYTYDLTITEISESDYETFKKLDLLFFGDCDFMCPIFELAEEYGD